MIRALVILFLLTGCSIPRLFQLHVPAPVTKADAQIEAERSAADLLARKIETPVELIPVAVSLSSSLGTPKKSLVDVKVFNLPTAAKTADGDLQTGIRDMQEQLRQVNLRLASLQGKPIEGTGISLLGPGMVTIIIALIALGVIFPPAFTFLFMAFRRLRSTTGKIVEGIESISETHEDNKAVSDLKSHLSAAMDVAEKRVVHAFQKP